MRTILNHRRTIILALADLAAIVFSCLVAYFSITFLVEVEYGGPIIVLDTSSVLNNSGILALCSIIGMKLCGVYRNIWRYASIKDFSKCVSGIIVGVVMYYAIRLITRMAASDIFIFSAAMISLVAVIFFKVRVTVIVSPCLYAVALEVSSTSAPIS